MSEKRKSGGEGGGMVMGGTSDGAAAPVLFPTSGRELLLELKRSSNNNGGISASSTTASSGSYLPPYNTKLTRACLTDLKTSIQTVQDIIHAASSSSSSLGEDNSKQQQQQQQGQRKPSMASRPSILFHHASIQRNKRCLLAYHKHRMDQLLSACGSTNHNHNDEAAASAEEGTDPTAKETSEGTNQNQTPTQSKTKQQQNQTQTYTTTNLHPSEIEFLDAYKELRELYADTMEIELNQVPPTSQYMVQVRVTKQLGSVVLDSGRSCNFIKGSCLYLQRNDALEYLQLGIVEHMEGEEIDF